MSGPLFNTQSFFVTSENGKLRLRMDLVKKADASSSDALPRKQPVFSLEEVLTGRMLWTREADWRVDFTKGLFISDEGWSVLHLGRDCPRLHVISPDGDEVFMVGIRHALSFRPERPPLWKGVWEVWADEHVRVTTAGTFWTMNARTRFVNVGSERFFVCRTAWGRYLVLDLSAARVVKEEEALPALSALLRPSDQKWALGVLDQVALLRVELETAIENRDGIVLSPPEMDRLYDDLEIALQIIRQDRVREAAEHLIALQDFQGPLYEGSIRVAQVRKYDEFQCDQVRKWIHLAMLAVGLKSKGHAINYFSQSEGGRGSLFLELPDCVPNRMQMLETLKPDMKPHEVLRRTGAPDAILESWYLGDSIPSDDEFDYERWDFDELGADGVLVSWRVLWRKSLREPARISNARPSSHSFRFMTADKCSPELVSVTRLEWTEAYRRMREEDHPM